MTGGDERDAVGGIELARDGPRDLFGALSRDEAHQFYEAVGYARTGLRFAKNLAPAKKRPAKSSVADADEE